MARIIAVSNRKGGTGKTTTAVNLASGLAIFKKAKVLLVDADPQSNATISLGFSQNIQPSLMDLMLNRTSLESIVYKTKVENLFIIPSNTNLSKIEPFLFHQNQGEYLLKNHLYRIEKNFDFIVIDCPPNIGMMGLNSLICAKEVLIPLKKEFLSIEATNQFLNILSKIIEKKNPKLIVDGILFTFTTKDPNTVQSEYIYFGPVNVRKLKTEIRYDPTLSEAPKYGKPIFLFLPSSKGAQDYMSLIEEIFGTTTTK
ncbi:MAG: ParA family protein [Brevinematales bacterium]|nr:ParA family protein [Brevinematales bacterium]